MRFTVRYAIGVLVWGVMILAVTSISPAEEIPHPDEYLPTLAQIQKHRAALDDPKSLQGTAVDPRNAIPKRLLDRITYDVDKMKAMWAEIVGFKAPEVTGKVAPEIKPGKYTYQEIRNNPGFKKLIPSEMYNFIGPGAPPFLGNIPEIEIIPTEQWYLSLPVAEATLKNMGKTKLDAQGYIIPESWEGGYPFPRPSGEFKAMQCMWNWNCRYTSWGGNFSMTARIFGVDRNLNIDMDLTGRSDSARGYGRVMMPPYGAADSRAKSRIENLLGKMLFFSPRDVAGTVRTSVNFLDQNTADQNLMYIPSLRRVRKLSATDTQDPVMGQDFIYDDTNAFSQKLTAKKYPYKYEVEEGEYLIPIIVDGTAYLTSDTFERRNVKMQRRPMYKLTLTQLDKNYVYSKRIMYMDREIFQFMFTENYDQKGRLYRTSNYTGRFIPEMGTLALTSSAGGAFYRDHVDKHSTVTQLYQYPAFWHPRKDLGMMSVIQRSK